MSELWQHQIDVIKMAEAKRDIFLAHEMGTGKTRTTIEVTRRRFAKRERLMKTLIISPVIVCDNWKKEFAAYSKINQRDILVLTQSGKRRCTEFTKAVGEDLARAKIVVTNYQGLLIKDFYKLLYSWQPEVLIVDESQRVKSHQSKTAKQLTAIADRAEQRFLLTGTPILNTPADLWQQFRILDGGETFGKNFYAFRNRYFKDENAAWASKQNHFAKYIIAPGAYEEIQERIKPKMSRVLKKDCLDLPPLVRQKYFVELAPEQKRMYEEMKEEFLAFVKETQASHPVTVAAQLAVTKALRLQQIISGYAATEQLGTHRFKENPRLDALSELLLDITKSEKAIVWACFKENYKMIGEMLEKQNCEYAQIHGDISNSQRIEEMQRFREDPKCRVMVANQSAGGAGINLVEASYSIYYSKGFSLEHDLQSEARNHRGGSEMHEKITRIDLVAKDTIDEHITEVLFKKQSVADTILNWR